MNREEMAQVFEKAAQVERTLGWTFGMDGVLCGNAPKCIEGAIAVALNDERIRNEHVYDMEAMRQWYPEVYVVLNRVLDRETRAYPGDPNKPWKWNDGLANTHSFEDAKETVATMLDWCAKEVRDA